MSTYIHEVSGIGRDPQEPANTVEDIILSKIVEVVAVVGHVDPHYVFEVTGEPSRLP